MGDLRQNAPSFAGILFGPGWPSGTPCGVRMAGRRVEASVDGKAAAAIPFAELALSFQGESDRYVCLSSRSCVGAARILVPDKTIIGELERTGLPPDALQSLRDAEADRRRRKSRHAAALGAAVAVIGALVLAAWILLRWAVGEAVESVPPAWEREIGRAAAQGVLAETAVCTDPKMNAAIQEIGRRLVMGLGATPYAWKVRVIDAPEVNAFALPGGYVFVNRGLVERASDGDEVAGVLAHELEHVVRRHGIENVARQLGLMIAARALLGDVGAVEQAIAGNAAQLASMSFSRDQEREADRLGLELAVRARFDPAGLERLMQTLAGEEGAAGAVMSFVSTHPASQERAEALAELRRKLGTPKVDPLAADWKAAKASCTPISVSDPDAP
jgi:beta-barrel assembly-enhancing protease